MKRTVKLANIYILLAVVMFSSYSNTKAAENKDWATIAVVNSVLQIKNVVLNKSSISDIESMIKNGINNGAKGLSLKYNPAYPTIKDMGWSFEDSKEREVFHVFFRFTKNAAFEGRYIGAQLSEELQSGADEEVLSMHRKMLSSEFKPLSHDKFDIENNCIATLSLFKNSSKPGVTVITVQCNQR